MKGMFLLKATDDESLSDDTITKNDTEISLHALSGTCTGQTMRLPISTHDQFLISLVDSGSTHCFLATRVARRLSLRLTTRDGTTVGVANDERLLC
jgi:hypothetical protein